MKISKLVDYATALADRFIPESLAADREAKKLARIFMFSHLFGPIIGSTAPIAISLIDASTDYRTGILLVAIFGFWLFPFALRYTGAYRLLTVISVQNLIFCTLWSVYCYGDVRSPTLAWLLTVPLLSFLYIGDSMRMRLIIIAQFVVSGAAFFALNVAFPPAPVTMAPATLQLLGLISTTAAALYVAMMALSYANAQASQVELKAEIDGHLRTTSELLAATESARRSSAAKGEFIAKMSHELRTPLNAVIGYSEILLEEAEENQDVQGAADLDRIHEAGVHLLKLVNEILDISRIEAGRMELSEEIIDCGDLLRSFAPRFAPLAQTKGVALRIEAARAPGALLVDVDKLRQALEQLIENAIAYTPQGEVALVAERVVTLQGDFVALTVADTGVGIARERIDGFFDRLETVEEADERHDAGAGVGLLLCKRLCDLLEAGLSLKSEPGRGSRFTILVPARVAEVEAHLLAEEGRRRLRTMARTMTRATDEGEPANAESATG